MKLKILPNDLFPSNTRHRGVHALELENDISGYNINDVVFSGQRINKPGEVTSPSIIINKSIVTSTSTTTTAKSEDFLDDTDKDYDEELLKEPRIIYSGKIVLNFPDGFL